MAKKKATDRMAKARAAEKGLQENFESRGRRQGRSAKFCQAFENAVSESAVSGLKVEMAGDPLILGNTVATDRCHRAAVNAEFRLAGGT